MDGHARSDGREGIPGKVKVGQRIHCEGIFVLRGGEIIAQAAAPVPQLGLAYASHHGRHHLPVRHLSQVLLQPVPGSLVLHAGLGQKLAQQVLAHRVVGNGFHHQIRQIHHLHALAPEAIRKGIMLPLGLPQIGDVVKEQSLQIFRHQIFQLPARAVEHDALEPANFRRIMDSRLQDKLTPFPVKLWVCVLGLVFLEVFVSCTKYKISVRFAQKKRRISPPRKNERGQGLSRLERILLAGLSCFCPDRPP